MRPVTLAVLGAGSRGTTFSVFAERFPDRARVVAVAEPRADRRDALADRLGVGADRRFADWRELAARGRVVDAVERSGVILAVCHVMRYTAYTEAVFGAVADGRVGDVVGVEHLEPVGWWH